MEDTYNLLDEKLTTMNRNKKEHKLERDLSESIQFIRQYEAQIPQIAIILGSGLGDFASQLTESVVIPTQDIPHYPQSTVPGHAGRWIFGTVDGIRILAVQGRIHVYEGYPASQVGYPVHLMASLGLKTLIVTTASGGIHPNLQPGDLMLITDHINLAFRNPMIGPPETLLGPRFPDMCQPYDVRLIALAEQAGLDLGIPLKRGVFCWCLGPTYETAAEIQMLRRIGADAVSMSTVPEVLVARQRGMSVLGFAFIANRGTGLSQQKLTHEDVTRMAEIVKPRFSRLMAEIIRRMALPEKDKRH